MILKNCCITELLEYLDNTDSNLCCVGAGNQLREALRCFEKLGFVERIGGIFDNHVTEFQYGGSRFDVKPTSSIKNCIDNRVVYICAAERYIELFELLDGYAELKDTDCYIHNYVRHIPVGKTVLSSAENDLIPKQIHYCWFGGKDIPPKNKKWMETWSEKCPDFDIIRWDENNYDYSKNRFMKRAYENGKYAFVSDCARLEIIYENGGIYLDNDVEVLQDFSELIKNHAFCGTYFSVPGVAFGLGFGGEKNFPLFKEMFEMYNNAEYVGNRYEDTCLFFQTEVLKKYGYNPLLNNQQKIKDLTIYSTEVLSPMDLDGTMLALTKNSYAVHHFDASWYEKGDHNELNKRRDKCRQFFEKRMKRL